MAFCPSDFRVLISYHYFKNADLDDLFGNRFPLGPPDVFADSGAFSGHTQGVPIDWREYAAWIKQWKHWFTTYSNLDVIGDPQGTYNNQKRLEDAGLEPLPVFHVGSPWSYLERYIERYSYIALGGMVPYASRFKTLMSWLVRCFRMAKGKAVYHGFGATSWRIMSSLPWYSVDSSTWSVGLRFGEIVLFDERKGGIFRIDLGSRACYQQAHYFRRYGLDPANYADRSRNTQAHNVACNVLSFMLAEAGLRKRFGEVCIPDRPDAKGPRIYLADSSNGKDGSLTSLAQESLMAAIPAHDQDEKARVLSSAVNLAASEGAE